MWRKMTQEEIYDGDIEWRGKESRRRERGKAIADWDIYEDERYVINRLYYIDAKRKGESLELCLFFEENRFEKEASGDLVLAETRYHMYPVVRYGTEEIVM